jgi:hypothetical protein
MQKLTERLELLKKPFKPDEVQWRITATLNEPRGLAVPYLDSRAIQNRLDEVIGRENWQNSYTVQPMIKDNAFISTISIFCEERGEWISKSNGAGSSNIEPIKGGLSDAFKRAASMWNIGRYLYEFSGVWVKLTDNRKAIDKAEYPRLEQVYVAKVKELFPRPVQTTSAEQSPIKLVAVPIYTVVSAKLNNSHTVISLTDGRNPAFTVYYNGEAMLAVNQCITDTVIHEKDSANGKFYVLESYRLANSSDYAQDSRAA